MSTFFNFRRNYSYESSILATDTPVTLTFLESLDALVVYTSIDLWIAETDAVTAGDGQTQKARVFIPAGVQRVLPWNAATCQFVNATAGEGAGIAVRLEGWIQ